MDDTNHEPTASLNRQRDIITAKMSSPDYAHHFSDRNIPFGIASSIGHPELHAVTRLANWVVSLDDCQKSGLFDGIEELPEGIFANDTLNEFAALPKLVHRRVREVIQAKYWNGGLTMKKFPPTAVEPVVQVQMAMPVRVGDFAGTYTTFREKNPGCLTRC